MTEHTKPARPTTMLGFAASGLGFAFWTAHMIMKYVVKQPIPALLWAGLAFIVLGFVIRRLAAR